MSFSARLGLLKAQTLSHLPGHHASRERTTRKRPPENVHQKASEEHEEYLLTFVHGHRHWRTTWYKFATSGIVRRALLVMLLVNALCCIGELFVAANYPFCHEVLRDATCCLVQGAGAGVDNADVCAAPVGGALSGQPDIACKVLCEPGSHKQVRQALKITLASIILVTLACLEAELLLLLVCLRGYFFRRWAYMLDLLAVTTILVIVLRDLVWSAQMRDSHSLTSGMTIAFLLFRLVRFLHLGRFLPAKAAAHESADTEESVRTAEEREWQWHVNLIQEEAEHLEAFFFPEMMRRQQHGGGGIAHSKSTPWAMPHHSGKGPITGHLSRRKPSCKPSSCKAMTTAAVEPPSPGRGPSPPPASCGGDDASPALRMRRKRSTANDEILTGQLRTSGSSRLKAEAKPEAEEKPPPAQLAPPSSDSSQTIESRIWNEEPTRPALPMPPPLTLASADAAGVDVTQPRAGDKLRCLLASDARALPAAEAQERLLRAATRIREASYSLRLFHDDMVTCFPELRLYLGTTPSGGGGGGGGGGSGAAASAEPTATMSGRTAEDEYRRTIGALCAVYWLLRLDVRSEAPSSAGGDGQRGFCFGVDAQWAPPSERAVGAIPARDGGADATAAQKRKAFLEKTDWLRLHALLVDAGLLRRVEGGEGGGGGGEGGGGGGGGGGEVEVVPARVVAMLSLTAIHDIMKVEALLPRVCARDAPYKANAEGARLIDHDLALAYVLECDAAALPSYAALGEAQRKAVRFTQAELGFNHGWLVQAEAPPGMLFAQLKKLLDTEGLAAADVAFYFVHWLTDLAGAEPTPLHGLEKFVLKFPQPVLLSLVNSMPLVQRLVDTPPAELFCEFLRQRWRETALLPSCVGELAPQPPSGVEGIALMRLVVQAQNEAEQRIVHDAFHALPAPDRALLAAEMALTGIAGTPYAATPGARGGPAFLVYYSPHFVRAEAKDNELVALRMLAEVYRAARCLWPRTDDAAASATTVTVHIGEMKNLRTGAIQDVFGEGDVWLLKRVSDKEAVVTRASLEEMDVAGGGAPGTDFLPLRFWPACFPTASTGDGSERSGSTAGSPSRPG